MNDVSVAVFFKAIYALRMLIPITFFDNIKF